MSLRPMTADLAALALLCGAGYALLLLAHGLGL